MNRNLYDKKEHSNKKRGKINTFRIIVPSLVCICICFVCFCGSTFALLRVEQQSGQIVITSASFIPDTAQAVDVSPVSTADLSESDNTAEPLTLVPRLEDGRYYFDLEANKFYAITLLAQGTAETGFYEIIFDGNLYYTIPIVPGHPMVINVQTSNATTFSFRPLLGSYVGESEYIIENNDVLCGREPDVNTDQDQTTDPVDGVVPDDVISDNGENQNSDPVDNVVPDNGENQNSDPVDNVVPDNNEDQNSDPVDNVVPDNGENQNFDPVDNVVPDNGENQNSDSVDNVVPDNGENQNSDPVDNVVPDNGENQNSDPIDNVVPDNGENQNSDPVDNVVSDNGEDQNSDSVDDTVIDSSEN